MVLLTADRLAEGMAILHIGTVCLILTVKSTEAQLANIPFEIVPVYNDHVPQKLSTTTPLIVRFKGACGAICKHDSECRGFFYHEATKACIPLLQDLSFPTDIKYFVDRKDGFRYYSMSATCPEVTSEKLVDKQLSICFQVISDKLEYWMQAFSACQVAGGRLAVLDTAQRLARLLMAMKNNSEFPTINYHIGCRRPLDKWAIPRPDGVHDFEWIDGRPLDLVLSRPYFSADDPNNIGHLENVILIYANIWRPLIDNLDTLGGYICEFPLI